MYFVISVLPISITSGPPPPARAASNFCRWSPQFWYWTFTVVPGWSDWNFWFAAATTSGQLDCASTCSQTVMLLAVALFVAPGVAAVIAEARTATRTSATMLRLLMWIPPGSGGPVAQCETRRRAFGTDQLPLRKMLSHAHARRQYQFRPGQVHLTDRDRRARERLRRPAPDSEPGRDPG